MSRPPVLVLLGPTAVGKTAVAVELGERLDGEVVSADSRQIYRGTEIGSAAPTAEEQARVRHHLVGFLDPRVAYSVAEFRVAAEGAIGDIQARGRTPLVVAGTGLYLRALVEGWSLTGVPADPALRAALEAEADRLGTAHLHERLAEVDPASAARIAPADRKRIIRALEVWRITGQPLSEHLATAGREPVPYDYHLFGLRREREALNQRIEQRVDAMLAAGWLDEVRALLAAGLTGGEPALEGLGYRHLVAALRGELPLDQAVALTKQDTRRFAKRQMTWFRAMPGIDWLDADTLSVALAAETVGEGWYKQTGRDRI
jgi:tRNA dimethylallyltransferase